VKLRSDLSGSITAIRFYKWPGETSPHRVNLWSAAGVLLGGSIPDPTRFGLDVIFPAAMGGLAVGLISGRRELVAGLAAIAIALSVSIAWDPAAGLIAGGVLGPLAGIAMPPAVRTKGAAPA